MSQSKQIPKTGKIMAIIAWLLGLWLLTQFFAQQEGQQYNPNQDPVSSQSGKSVSITLDANNKGHYLVNGHINNLPATFLLDTGATDVVIPASLADRFDLPELGQGIGLTANGRVKVTRTTINVLSIGDITLYNVPASINPGMNKMQAVLLGMSALGRLELNQRDGELRLIQR